MLITQLEGKVPPTEWERLKQNFAKSAQNLPSAIVQSYLVQDQTDQEIWRVVTVWHSRQALQDYRSTVETPEGVLMFRGVGIEPSLSIAEVIEHVDHD